MHSPAFAEMLKEQSARPDPQALHQTDSLDYRPTFLRHGRFTLHGGDRQSGSASTQGIVFIDASEE